MASVGFVQLGKCLLKKASSGQIIGEVENLVLNTRNIHKIVPDPMNSQGLGAKITTIFDEVIDVPAPGAVLDDDYTFGNIVNTIAQAGKEGFSSLF